MQRRILAASCAQMLGHGGATAVAEASGLSRRTVHRGLVEIGEDRVPMDGRVRRPGAGRPPIEELQPGLLEALDALVEPHTRGDPMCRLRWTSKSTRKLAEELQWQGFDISHVTVADLLVQMGYTLQAPSKTENGSDHPDRDAQFEYLAAQVAEHLEAGEPVVSIDAKKKEAVGDLANAGREWQPKGEPVLVKDHDFPEKGVPKAVPFGVYDLAGNEGWVTVGTSADTAQFAVDTVERWWEEMGSKVYPDATRILITADAGGSNSYRSRLWKREIAALAERIQKDITICHLPPGTSKWNKIEHRMFSHITMNWRGRPLESHEVVVNLIAGTTTRAGLRIRAELSEKTYAKGIEVSDKEIARLPIAKHEFHGEWNYTVRKSSDLAE
jgi:hypothetical protein